MRLAKSPFPCPAVCQEEAEEWLKHMKPSIRAVEWPDLFSRKRAMIAAFRGVPRWPSPHQTSTQLTVFKHFFVDPPPKEQKCSAKSLGTPSPPWGWIGVTFVLNGISNAIAFKRRQWHHSVHLCRGKNTQIFQNYERAMPTLVYSFCLFF